MENKIKKIVAEATNRPLESITLDSNIVKDLGADSLDVMDLALVVEESFTIAFDDDDYKRMNTVRELCDVVKEKLNGDPK